MLAKIFNCAKKEYHAFTSSVERCCNSIVHFFDVAFARVANFFDVASVRVGRFFDVASAHVALLFNVAFARVAHFFDVAFARVAALVSFLFVTAKGSAQSLAGDYSQGTTALTTVAEEIIFGLF